MPAQDRRYGLRYAPGYATFRPEMTKYHFDPKKYRTYLEQLGIAYPTVRRNTEATERGKP